MITSVRQPFSSKINLRTLSPLAFDDLNYTVNLKINFTEIFLLSFKIQNQTATLFIIKYFTRPENRRIFLSADNIQIN